GDVWIEPNERYAPPGRLAGRDQGRRALVIANDTAGLIATPAATSSDNAIHEVLHFVAAELGPAAVTVVSRASGGGGTGLRMRHAMRANLPSKSSAGGATSYGGTEIHVATTAVDDVATPFEVTREIKDSERVSSGGNYVAIDLPASEVLSELAWTARRKTP